MTRKPLHALLLALLLGAAHAADGFVPPPPLPAPPPYPSDPYKEQVYDEPPLPNSGGQPVANQPRGDANRPYFGVGLQYVADSEGLPPIELHAGIDTLLGLPLLGVRADLHAHGLDAFAARLNAVANLGGATKLYLAGGPRWGHLRQGDSNYQGLYYGAAVGARLELGRVNGLIEIRLDSTLTELRVEPSIQFSLLYFP